MFEGWVNCNSVGGRKMETMTFTNAYRRGRISCRCRKLTMVLLSCAVIVTIAFNPCLADASDKKVLIQSQPPGAKVVLVGGGMICKTTARREGVDGVTPCTFSIDSSAFDPDGRYWASSKILGVPLKISMSKEGYRPAEIFLTEENPRIWRGKDVVGTIERKYFFVKQEKFEVQLEKEPDYAEATLELLKSRPPEGLREITARDALADCKRFYEQGNLEKAIQACNVAIGVSANNPNPDVYHYRCLSNYRMNRFDAALQDCEDLTRLQPSNAVGWNNTGLILQLLGRHELAVESFSKALSLDKSNVKTFRNRALSYEKLNRIPEAISDSEAALTIAPNDSETLALRTLLQNRLRPR